MSFRQWVRRVLGPTICEVPGCRYFGAPNDGPHLSGPLDFRDALILDKPSLEVATEVPSLTPTPVEEMIYERLREEGFDETDAGNAAQALEHLVRSFGATERGKGIAYGDASARESIGRRIGVIR